ncbi:hypothetical protein ABE28_012410 [Peribacillus muralis]|uniref:Uncharacterized protein n=1 Tax=Peribacillus muralis TaxID=264697 RepID=A0A1B3XPL8_9BACI|nr:hypothetical protein [Peribacillus muralis]AOH55153.1 hypothetical protein ABE28_012410 [Peribacillus muralis]
MEIEVGSVIYELRIEQNLTRKERSKDICEPDALLDYERSISSPTKEELALLIVDLPYFFMTKNEPIYNYVKIIKLLVNMYKRLRNYETIYEIVEKEMENRSGKIDFILSVFKVARGDFLFSFVQGQTKGDRAIE